MKVIWLQPHDYTGMFPSINQGTATDQFMVLEGGPGGPRMRTGRADERAP
ncbi:MAG: hypothetical protein ABI780_03555 [Ardenticatenales bacterium]